MLLFIFLVLFFSLLTIAFIPGTNKKLIQSISLFSSGLVLIISSYTMLDFDYNKNGFQNIVNVDFGFSVLNFNFSFGLDGISIFFFHINNRINFFVHIIRLKWNIFKGICFKFVVYWISIIISLFSFRFTSILCFLRSNSYSYVFDDRILRITWKKN